LDINVAGGGTVTNKLSMSVDGRLDTLRKQYLEAGQRIAEKRQDKALSEDMSALWTEFIQVLRPVGALPSNYLAVPDDWPDRPAGERQHYVRAQLAANLARNYTDDGWQALEKAVARAEKSRQYLQDQVEALKKTESSRQALERAATEDKIKDLEAQLEILERRHTEMHRDIEDHSLDDSGQRELDRLTQEIDDTKISLQTTRIMLEVVYNPRNASLFYDPDLHRLNSMREELNKTRVDHRAVARRQLQRRAERWGSMLVVAILIFLLGKFSDHFLLWPLAAATAFVLWLVDVKIVEPFLQRRDAKRMRRGLLDDTSKMYMHKNRIRMQQADYNYELRKAGIEEIHLFPLVQAPPENWFRDLVRDVQGSDAA
jgi:hypothetical protein